MGRRILGFAASLLLACLLWSHACAQGGGSRAGLQLRGLGGFGAYGAGLEEQPGEVPQTARGAHPDALDVHLGAQTADPFARLDSSQPRRLHAEEALVVQ